MTIHDPAIAIIFGLICVASWEVGRWIGRKGFDAVARRMKRK